jgi:hypothetical protein
MGIRKPDYISFSIDLPIKNSNLYFSLTATLDRNGTLYLTVLCAGFNFPRSTGVSVSVSINWLSGDKPSLRNQVPF